ncbi:MAG: hypothetical protein HY401_04645 [Elusimicrobia bacterium]|nr:hypothetical protein [Elusimicrobiota bacterium]
MNKVINGSWVVVAGLVLNFQLNAQNYDAFFKNRNFFELGNQNKKFFTVKRFGSPVNAALLAPKLTHDQNNADSSGSQDSPSGPASSSFLERQPSKSFIDRFEVIIGKGEARIYDWKGHYDDNDPERTDIERIQVEVVSELFRQEKPFIEKRRLENGQQEEYEEYLDGHSIKQLLPARLVLTVDASDKTPVLRQAEIALFGFLVRSQSGRHHLGAELFKWRHNKVGNLVEPFDVNHVAPIYLMAYGQTGGKVQFIYDFGMDFLPFLGYTDVGKYADLYNEQAPATQTRGFERQSGFNFANRSIGGGWRIKLGVSLNELAQVFWSYDFYETFRHSQIKDGASVSASAGRITKAFVLEASLNKIFKTDKIGQLSLQVGTSDINDHLGFGYFPPPAEGSAWMVRDDEKSFDIVDEAARRFFVNLKWSKSKKKPALGSK